MIREKEYSMAKDTTPKKPAAKKTTLTDKRKTAAKVPGAKPASRSKKEK
jgi:hypothetical protein